MGLTADEQLELQKLQGEVGHLDQASKLSPDEQAEMAKLQSEVGHLDKPAVMPTANPGIGQTALEHGANALTLGYLPQIQAAAEKPMTWVLNKLTGNHVEADPYVKARDENISRLQMEQQANPKTAFASQVGGGLVGAALTPELSIGRSAGLLSMAGKGAAYGTAYGALQNPGDKPGEISPLQLKERASNAYQGAKTGAITGAATGLVAKGIRSIANAPEAAEQMSQRQAFKSTGAMLKDWRAAGMDKAEDIGQFALDNGLVQMGDSVESVGKKAAALNQKAGQDLDAIYSKAVDAVKKNPSNAQRGAGYLAENEKQLQVGKQKVPVVHEPSKGINSFISPTGKPMWATAGEDQLTSLPVGADEKNFFNKGFDPVRDKKAILDAVNKKLGNAVGKDNATGAVSNYLDQLARDNGAGVLDPKTANNIKGDMDAVIRYSRKPLQPDPIKEQAFHTARTFVKKAIDEHIDEIGKLTNDPDLKARLQAANQQYGYSKAIKDMAVDRLERVNANQAAGLTDKIAASGAGIVGGGLGSMVGDNPKDRAQHGIEGAVAAGLLGGAINHYGHKYGAPIMARGLQGAQYPLLVPATLAEPTAQIIANPEFQRGLIQSRTLKAGNKSP